MATKEELISSFDFINVQPTEEVIKKSIALCSKYNLDVDDFVDLWSAFTISNLNGKQPTVEFLEAMERKDLVRREICPFGGAMESSKHDSKKSEDKTPESGEVSGAQGSDGVISKGNKRIHNPEVDLNLKKSNIINDALQNESVSEEKLEDFILSLPKFCERSNALLTVASFGNLKLLKVETFQNETKKICTFQLGIGGKKTLGEDAKYMFEVLTRKRDCLNYFIEKLGWHLVKKNKFCEVKTFNKHSSSNFVTYGRIHNQNPDKKTYNGIMLEGDLKLNRGKTIKILMDGLDKFSCFPGQVVVVQGRTFQKKMLYLEQIDYEVPPEFPPEKPILQEKLQFVVAAGPFTIKNNLSYEPLQDLIKYVIIHKPHILILTGPFLDSANDLIEKENVEESYESFFDTLIESLMTPLKDLHTQVLIVSSCKDAHHHMVYPTPPYSMRYSYSNLHFLPDPSMINIEGIVIGLTTADIMFHLARVEVSRGFMNDRMTRLASHLLNQRSFYPLYPPNREMAVDHELLKDYGMIDVKPHVLILPSNFRFFIKNIEGCITINPERLVKGYSGGTFARFAIHPNSNSADWNIAENISCQILQI